MRGSARISKPSASRSRRPPMRSGTWVTNVRFAPAPHANTEYGLLGWISFDLGGSLHVDGVTLRRTRGGRLTLSFPSRIDRRGTEHPYLRPTCSRARRAIERAVLSELGPGGAAVTAELPTAHQEPHEIARAPGCGSRVQSAVD